MHALTRALENVCAGGREVKRRERRAPIHLQMLVRNSFSSRTKARSKASWFFQFEKSGVIEQPDGVQSTAALGLFHPASG
jgi:hypothetical protein